MSERYTSWLFKSAACFNILAGMSFLAAPQRFTELMGLAMNQTATLFGQILFSVVVLFGWAYWMIAVDPLRYRTHIVLGILGKSIFVVIIYGHWLAGNIPWPLAAVVTGDTIYALLFLHYYRHSA